MKDLNKTIGSDSGNSNWGLCNYLEGWKGGGGGEREIQEGGDMCTNDRFMLMYGRNQCSILKQLFLN